MWFTVKLEVSELNICSLIIIITWFCIIIWITVNLEYFQNYDDFLVEFQRLFWFLCSWYKRHGEKKCILEKDEQMSSNHEIFFLSTPLSLLQIQGFRFFSLNDWHFSTVVFLHAMEILRLCSCQSSSQLRDDTSHKQMNVQRIFKCNVEHTNVLFMYNSLKRWWWLNNKENFIQVSSVTFSLVHSEIPELQLSKLMGDSI